ncbi:hypothetical protein [Desulfofundulus sp.]|uniref:hypothetical protein n=1 Tax=Desulfofundulus sp. TaxID=2282750 RepID=UPI003C75739F
MPWKHENGMVVCESAKHNRHVEIQLNDGTTRCTKCWRECVFYRNGNVISHVFSDQPAPACKPAETEPEFDFKKEYEEAVKSFAWALRVLILYERALRDIRNVITRLDAELEKLEAKRKEDE